jgi:hypothetical protein
MSRHGRQTRLVEVGAAGQARIAAATFVVASEGLAAEVATRYLAGAGAGCVRVRDAALRDVAAAIDPAVRVAIADGDPAIALDSELRDPGARAVAQGAREALRALRGALGVGATS